MPQAAMQRESEIFKTKNKAADLPSNTKKKTPDYRYRLQTQKTAINQCGM